MVGDHSMGRHAIMKPVPISIHAHLAIPEIAQVISGLFIESVSMVLKIEHNPVEMISTLSDRFL